MPSGTVLVTGASTGIGEATVLHLRELGFDVIGAVRKDEDAERLEGQGLRTVRLDVTDAAQIAAARDSLGDAPLAGLVNNAGIAVASPLEFIPVDRLRQQLEVDLILIEPGGVKTPIWKKGASVADEIQADMPPEAARLYGRMIERVRAETRTIDEELGSEPRAVAE